MTDYQRQKRARLEETRGTPRPGATDAAMRELLEIVVPGSGSCRIDTDDHPAYRRPIQEIGPRLRHFVTPGNRRRTRANSLWDVNLIDSLIRHASSNHKRETIAWSKRRQGSAEKLAILLVWRNYMKGISEKVLGSPTPAMIRGMKDRPLRINEMLSSRLFPGRSSLPGRWVDNYTKSVPTRALDINRLHNLVYAY